MNGIVVFDDAAYALWMARYPELAPSVSFSLASAYFSEAGLYLDNTACSPIRDDSPGGRRAILLNMLISHIAVMNSPINGIAPSGMIGRITSATEGTVSIKSDLNVPCNAGWFSQTRYGYAFWQATAAIRTMHYIPGRPRQFNPVGAFMGTNFGPWVH